MTDRVTVSADRTRLLPPNAPEKGYRITRQEAAGLGLVDSAEKPVQERRVFDHSKAVTPPVQKRRPGRPRKNP